MLNKHLCVWREGGAGENETRELNSNMCVHQYLRRWNRLEHAGIADNGAFTAIRSLSKVTQQGEGADTG